MKTSFPGYNRPTRQEFEDLWDNCLFVFDTSALLDLPDLSQDATDKLFEILDHVSDRIWIPHQVALEFHRNSLAKRMRSVHQQNHLHSFAGTLGRFKKQLTRAIDQFPDAEDLAVTLASSLDELEELLDTHLERGPDPLEMDQGESAIVSRFEGKVGPNYSVDRLDQIYREGAARYARQDPPGYKDLTEKGGIEVYGDLVLWYQILDKAEETQAPVVLVINEKKTDWWLSSERGIVAPRPELRQEMLQQTSVQFYMYRLKQFVKHADEHFDLSVETDVYEELQHLEEKAEDIPSYSTYPSYPPYVSSTVEALVEAAKQAAALGYLQLDGLSPRLLAQADQAMEYLATSAVEAARQLSPLDYPQLYGLSPRQLAQADQAFAAFQRQRPDQNWIPPFGVAQHRPAKRNEVDSDEDLHQPVEEHPSQDSESDEPSDRATDHTEG